MMKDLFDSLKKSAYIGSKVITDKTKDVVQKTKDEVDIQKLKYDNNKYFRQIGILTYKAAQDEISDPSDKIKHLLKEIEYNMNIIENIKKGQADDSEEVIVEPTDDLDDEVEVDKVVIEPKKNEEGYFVMRFCKHCNIGNHPDSTHCVNCGRRLK